MANFSMVLFGLSGPVTQPTSDVPGGEGGAGGGAGRRLAPAAQRAVDQPRREEWATALPRLAARLARSAERAS